MQWDLAGYDSHPIDGDAGQVSSLASNLGTVASDIRSQIDRINAINSGDFWESSAGSADSFQEVVEDLPEKLGLVATRYENVAAALDTFHPVLADTKQDAEYWIEQAAVAQEEVERCESGVELMDDFAEQAETDAEAANEDREDGDPEVEPDEWQGENYHESLAQAQEDLDNAVSNVQSAVGDFESAAESCASAIHEAGNDDLENEGGLFGAIGRAWDAAMDFLDVYIQVLQIIGAVLAVVALFVPGLNLIVLAISVTVLLGTLLLYADGRRTGWDVVAATVGVATGALSVASTFAAAGRLGALGTRAATGLRWADRGVGAASGWVSFDSDGPSWDIQGGIVSTLGAGIDGGLDIGGVNLGAGPGGDLPFTQYGNEILGGGWQEGTTSIGSLLSAGNNSFNLGTDLGEAIRPDSESGIGGFEGLDIAVSPGDMAMPEISPPDIGPIEIPQMDMPPVAVDVNVPVTA